MDEYVMHDVRITRMPLMGFMMNATLYDFCCVKKEDELWRFVLQVIDGCYLLVELICLFVCMSVLVYVSRL